MTYPPKNSFNNSRSDGTMPNFLGLHRRFLKKFLSSLNNSEIEMEKKTIIANITASIWKNHLRYRHHLMLPTVLLHYLFTSTFTTFIAYSPPPLPPALSTIQHAFSHLYPRCFIRKHDPVSTSWPCFPFPFPFALSSNLYWFPRYCLLTVDDKSLVWSKLLISICQKKFPLFFFQ